MAIVDVQLNADGRVIDQTWRMANEAQVRIRPRPIRPEIRGREISIVIDSAHVWDSTSLMQLAQLLMQTSLTLGGIPREADVPDLGRARLV